jgi:hypothetical protein
MRVIIISVLCMALLTCGCIGEKQQWTDITVKDRVMTPEHMCSCSISTTNGAAYSVSTDRSCVLLSPGTHASIGIIGNYKCDIEAVEVIP